MTRTTIDTLTLDCEHFGGHADHWRLLSRQPQQDVALWLHQALDQPESPMGLCDSESALPADVWLIQGPAASIQISQIISVSGQRPTSLCTAFPVLTSPYHVSGTITRISECTQTHQAVLCLELADGSSLYGFDTLYAVNAGRYQAGQTYQVNLAAWAYNLEAVPDSQQLLIDDPAAIRHHRALNAILAAHDGQTPDNLQQLLADWQPQSADDEAPVTLDITHMVAYLYGDTLGQEDEAWFQGDIVGKSQTTFAGRTFDLYDVAILRENPDQPVIVRLALAADLPDQPDFAVGQYVRGNIWLQFGITHQHKH